MTDHADGSVSVKILDKEYKIACSNEEHDELLNTALQLDHHMREIRASGKVNSPERIAVMAALNLANELAQTQKQKQKFNLSDEINNRLINLRHKIEHILESS